MASSACRRVCKYGFYVRSALGEQAPSGAICYKYITKRWLWTSTLWNTTSIKRNVRVRVDPAFQETEPTTLARHAPIDTLNRALGYREAFLLYRLADGIATDTQAIKIGVKPHSRSLCNGDGVRVFVRIYSHEFDIDALVPCVGAHARRTKRGRRFILRQSMTVQEECERLKKDALQLAHQLLNCSTVTQPSIIPCSETTSVQSATKVYTGRGICEKTEFPRNLSVEFNVVLFLRPAH